MGPGGPFSHPGKIDRLAEHLELSETQRDQIEDLVNATRRAARPHRDGLRAVRKQLRALRSQSTFDEGALRELAKTQAAYREELMVLWGRTQAEIRGLLTPAQQSALKEMKPRRKAKRRRS